VVEYMTSNLALASFLSMNGLAMARFFTDPTDEDTAFFVFNLTGPYEVDTMDRLVDLYERGAARVEPTRFLREVSTMRRQLYGYLESREARAG